jgi:hypothetical protein
MDRDARGRCAASGRSFFHQPEDRPRALDTIIRFIETEGLLGEVRPAA